MPNRLQKLARLRQIIEAARKNLLPRPLEVGAMTMPSPEKCPDCGAKIAMFWQGEALALKCRKCTFVLAEQPG